MMWIFWDAAAEMLHSQSLFSVEELRVWTESSKKDRHETAAAQVIFKSGDALQELAKCGEVHAGVESTKSWMTDPTV